MAIRLLVNSVGFQVNIADPDGRVTDVIQGSITREGHVSILKPTPYRDEDMTEYQTRAHERSMDRREKLVVLGMAQYEQVGPGEHELYATDRLREIVRASVRNLPADWMEWE